MALLPRDSMSSQLCQKLIQLIDPSGILPQKISNLARKVKDYIKKENARMAQISSMHIDPRLNLPNVFQAHGITYENIINKSIPELKEPIALSVSDMVYLRSILQRKKSPLVTCNILAGCPYVCGLGKTSLFR